MQVGQVKRRHLFRFAQGHILFDRTELGRQLHQQIAKVQIKKHHAIIGMIQDVCNLFRKQARIDRVQNGTDTCNGIVEL